MTNIIKDLGRRPAGAQGNKIRFYLLECTNPTCKTQYEQNASNMKRSKNGLCYECSNKLKNKSKQLECSNNFVKKAIDIHGDLYSYSKVSYVAAIESVIITCNRCNNDYNQTPHTHLSGGGCTSCNKGGGYGRRPKKGVPGILYYFEIDGLYKIGITTKTLNKRYRRKDLVRMNMLKTWFYTEARDAFEQEQIILKQYKHYKYTGASPFQESEGKNELFTMNVLGL